MCRMQRKRAQRASIISIAYIIGTAILGVSSADGPTSRITGGDQAITAREIVFNGAGKPTYIVHTQSGKYAYTGDGKSLGNIRDFPGEHTVYEPNSVDYNSGQPALTTLEDGYYVQIGAFRVAANAHHLSQNVSYHRQAHIEPTTIGAESFYRVLIGPNISPAKAVRVQKRLARNDSLIDTFIVQR